MPGKKPLIEFYSHGIYETWDRSSRTIPKLKRITTNIPIEPDVEFGYVLKIRKAKGSRLTFVIQHPPFPDEDGDIALPFEGTEYITSNDWSFFLGDTVWPPFENKAGKWELITTLDGKEIARKRFNLILPESTTG
jgi:hypothetical protein